MTTFLPDTATCLEGAQGQAHQPDGVVLVDLALVFRGQVHAVHGIDSVPQQAISRLVVKRQVGGEDQLIDAAEVQAAVERRGGAIDSGVEEKLPEVVFMAV